MPRSRASAVECLRLKRWAALGLFARMHSVCLTLADLHQPLELAELFGRNAPTELEIGAGRGDFLIEYGQAHPELNLIGIERSLVILRRAINKVQRADLENIVLINAEIRYLLENYFQPSSLRAIHVYFPDPWPKKRHAKRRLFTSDIIDLFVRALTPEGYLHLRTDVDWYFDVTKQLVAADGRFLPLDPPPDITSFLTGFERRFIADGKPLYRISYRMDVQKS